MKSIHYNEVSFLNTNVKGHTMATTNDDFDDAEQLRLIALQSMVRRTMKSNSNQTNDDQDILLLRAAALQSIASKIDNRKNTKKPIKIKSSSIKSQNVRAKKRSKSDRLPSPSKNHKHRGKRKKEDNLAIDNLSIDNYENVIEDNKEKPVEPNKVEAKKIVKNGSMLLSNLNSEGIDETMVIKITFSSTESDDSSSDTDDSKVKESVYFNNDSDSLRLRLNPPAVDQQRSADNFNSNKDNSVILEDHKLKKTEVGMEKLLNLLKMCNSEIEKRDQQVKILLEAYNTYKSLDSSVHSMLESIKAVHKELSELNPTENT
ncbi:uncharacterized protein LOC126836949 [Adelges cooleyi]|uniref:uncharacterized protein LOC126836949 n=1 Tax=Adelges cooleyi TaxID=133065 RepID=UPI0021805AE6|nr:uncharacterized protein LOC126836949 [Adelges cooleyi]